MVSSNWWVALQLTVHVWMCIYVLWSEVMSSFGPPLSHLIVVYYLGSLNISIMVLTFELRVRKICHACSCFLWGWLIFNLITIIIILLNTIRSMFFFLAELSNFWPYVNDWAACQISRRLNLFRNFHLILTKSFNSDAEKVFCRNNIEKINNLELINILKPFNQRLDILN